MALKTAFQRRWKVGGGQYEAHMGLYCDDPRVFRRTSLSLKDSIAYHRMLRQELKDRRKAQQEVALIMRRERDKRALAEVKPGIMGKVAAKLRAFASSLRGKA